MADSDLHARVVGLPHEITLPAVHIHDQGLPESMGVTDRVAHRRDESVRIEALVRAYRVLEAFAA